MKSKLNYIELKIDEVYAIALKLGLEKATDTEKELFKNALCQLAVWSIDDARSSITELLNEKSKQILNPTI